MIPTTVISSDLLGNECSGIKRQSSAFSYLCLSPSVCLCMPLSLSVSDCLCLYLPFLSLFMSVSQSVSQPASHPASQSVSQSVSQSACMSICLVNSYIITHPHTFNNATGTMSWQARGDLWSNSVPCPSCVRAPKPRPTIA